MEVGSLRKQRIQRNSTKGNELRRIIYHKEFADMVTKFGKYELVHICAIDEPVEGLALFIITYNFIAKESFERFTAVNLDSVEKANVKYVLNETIVVVSIRKQRIQMKYDTRRSALIEARFSVHGPLSQRSTRLKQNLTSPVRNNTNFSYRGI
ncbi:hypothetical protein Cgig2_032826 [Carnegiea gigantea]|uniref:Uncharacterized protein n=1 Tax=Carnegiea gigantea TaxID=171969 RepID=A0A9Q1Q5R1_9CARY|nr:hypothetical protein Cgig2_032826 [Carnegiea gigantea]